MADTIHRDLVDSELHETKGISTAITGQVLVADGLGSGSWSETTTFVPVQEAPIDGHLYARQNGLWTVSPSDPNVLHFGADTSAQTPPPSNRSFRWNHASQAAATELYFDYQDQGNRTVSDPLLAVGVGDRIGLVDSLNLSHKQTWDVVSVTDNTTYVTYVVTFVEAVGGDFFDGQDILWVTTPAIVAALEDVSIDGQAGKVLTINNTSDGIELVEKSTYGLNTYYSENLSQATDMAQIWTNQLTASFVFEAGMYDLDWSFITGTGVTNKLSEFRVQLDGNDIVAAVPWQGATSSMVSGNRRIPLNGLHDITIDFRAAEGATTAYMYNTNLRFVSV